MLSNCDTPGKALNMNTHFRLNCFNQKSYFLCLAVIFACTGCTSFTSTVVGRSRDAKFSGNLLMMRSKGIPCKFKVPTHVEVTIEETYFLDPKTGDVLVPEKRILDVTTNPIYSDQLFMVEVIRPFAGTLDMTGKDKGFFFNEKGYLTKIGASIEDKTIRDANEVLASSRFKDLVKKKSTVTGGEGLTHQTRTVAIKRFNIAECDWHIAMSDWVDQYVNECTKTCVENYCPIASQTVHSHPQLTQAEFGNPF